MLSVNILFSFLFSMNLAIANDLELPAVDALKKIRLITPSGSNWNAVKITEEGLPYSFEVKALGKSKAVCRLEASFITENQLDEIFVNEAGDNASQGPWIPVQNPNILPRSMFAASLKLKDSSILYPRNWISAIVENRECLKPGRNHSASDLPVVACKKWGKLKSLDLRLFFSLQTPRGNVISIGCRKQTNDLKQEEIEWGDIAQALSGIFEFKF